MRILHIGMSSFPGGVENFVRNYYLALQNENIVFDFVDIYGDGIAFQDEFAEMGSRFFFIPNYKKHPFYAKKKLAEIIKDYTCVHIHMLSAASIIAVEAAQSAGVEPIVHAHNSDTVGIVRVLLHRFHLRKLRSIPSVHLACSNEAGDWMWGDTGFTVLANAIDIEQFVHSLSVRKKIRGYYGCGNGVTVVGFVGRLALQKNPLFAVQVFEAYHRKNPDSLLWIVGGGDMEEAVRREIRQRDLSDQVVLFGGRSDVHELMQAMDMLLFPSVFEGFGITVIEAQAAGLPVIASDVLPEEAIVLDSVKLASLDDSAEAWADVMLVMTPLADRTSCAGKIADADYDIHTAAQELLRIYNGKSSH